METPVHLHIGQEAVPVGVCAHLNAEDTLFFGHRTHGPAISKGIDLNLLMAELHGRTTGCSRAYGGSMHVVDPARGMLGSSSIVGGAIALGVGSALAAKLRGEPRISVSFFGDGAADAGLFWESINFAALKAVPVLFVCEDNGLSNVMRREEHMFADLGAIAGNFMPVARADGTDVLSVYHAIEQAVGYVRKQRGPAYVHCPTKRWMKHQGVDVDDLDFNPVDREKDCPIHNLQRRLIDAQYMTESDVAAMVEDVERQIDRAVEFAVSSPFPLPSALVSEV